MEKPNPTIWQRPTLSMRVEIAKPVPPVPMHCCVNHALLERMHSWLDHPPAQIVSLPNVNIRMHWVLRVAKFARQEGRRLV